MGFHHLIFLLEFYTQSEITNFGYTICRDEYVFRFQVTMNDVRLMCETETLGDLLTELHFFGLAQSGFYVILEGAF